MKENPEYFVELPLSEKFEMSEPFFNIINERVNNVLIRKQLGIKLIEAKIKGNRKIKYKMQNWSSYYWLQTEAAIQGCSVEKVFSRYAAN